MAHIIPNTYIIGAPKCGTTSLATWLAAHPDVFMSNPKEPYFFCRPSLQIAGINTLEKYSSLFKNANGKSVVAEASTATLYDETALPLIKQAAPDARLVVMLRDPVDMVLSWHAESVRQMREDLISPVEAWRAVADRRKGQRILPKCPDPIMLDYIHMGSLGTQLERVYALFPRKQVHVAFLDDFITAPRAAWCNLLEFLGIPDDGRQSFPAENKGYLPKHLSAYRAIRVNTSRLKKLLGIKRSTGWVAQLTSSMGVPYSKRSLPADFLSELRSAFEPELHKLEQSTGRDLTCWRRAL
jgi:hypothetical protein